tara:strand:+ start:656 stop:1966 length:1311 start_codon:yes stop_codon:yes gene_type:complete
MPIINIRQFNIKSLKKNFSLHIFFKRKFSIEIFFTVLIILGIPLNLYKNRFYDNSWTVGEWLISYAGGFVRRGLPGELIHFISNHYSLSPILLVWLLSVFALLSLASLVLNFCKNLFDKSFLLSQLIILAPLSDDYFVRKDAFLVLSYGLSLLIMKALYQKRIKKLIVILAVNFISMIAIFSHESYGIWGLPSLLIIFFLFEKSDKKNTFRSFLYATLFLMPSIFSFFLCWFFKGDINHSLMIHQSWQSLAEIMPSISALYKKEPTGAIAAIGWGTSQVFTSSLLSQFNLFIFWHPGMWFFTIYIAMRLFIGNKKDLNQKLKRTIICSQLIAFIPMFLFVDIGRWIFMWLTSSALLFSFLYQTFGQRKLLYFSSILRGEQILTKIIPGFTSTKNYNYVLLFFGIPHCCWSLGRYLVSNPIGFGIKNIIFYTKFLFS